jgi:hypothetical protein
MGRLTALLATSLIAGTSWADTYRVVHNGDPGHGGLRWAIVRANRHAGPDRIVFRRSLKGAIIRPTTPLPTIADDETRINADIDNDGAPDVQLSGASLTQGSGLVITADRCMVAGLAIVKFPAHGIHLKRTSRCTIHSCHIGVNLAGTARRANAGSGIQLDRSTQNRIGGQTRATRNVIDAALHANGIFLASSSRNTIAHNYIGVTRDGMTVLPRALPHAGIRLGDGPTRPANRNTIGGAAGTPLNVIAGATEGIVLEGAGENAIRGNSFGLASDGETELPTSGIGIRAYSDTYQNVIGGTSPASRNTFAGYPTGIRMIGHAMTYNRVQGNYFGTNWAGTQKRGMGVCVDVYGHGDQPQIIGGPTSSHGNYFVPDSPDSSAYSTRGVWTGWGHDGTIVRHNRFGMLPNGRLGPDYDFGVAAGGETTVTDNKFVNALVGVSADGAEASVQIYRNRFRRCRTAVVIEPESHVDLGQLWNNDPRDDGKNIFGPGISWYVRNLSDRKVWCEGNDFGTRYAFRIDAQIWDKLDDSSLGRVDYIPLMGGIIPIVPMQEGALIVSSVSTTPARAGGAEIAFSLSAPANLTVTVLNIAGRAVATVTRDRSTEAGLQRITWAGHSDRGTLAPNGTYLARIVARDADGQQAQAICSLRLNR